MIMDDDKKGLYIESTIPSYATARISRDIITAGRQFTTKLFWEHERHKYDLYISGYVVDECSDGDSDAAQRRLDFISGIESLDKSKAIDELGAIYQELLQIPDKAKTDCYHLATCVKAKIHWTFGPHLLSWNCTHLGLASYEKVKNYNDNHGLWTPFLVNPGDLMEYKEVL
jgi:hypothetical protein